MTIFSSILLAASLCADCFAVSLCSGVTLRSLKPGPVALTSAAFALIQTGLLFAGWAFGWAFVGMVSKISHILGFLLLLYVGGSMILEAARGRCERRDLNGFVNVLLAGLATSIDALAVGAATSLSGSSRFSDVLPLLIYVFVITAVSVVLGICCGKFIGSKAGRTAEFIGGGVLITIGILILI